MFINITTNLIGYFINYYSIFFFIILSTAVAIILYLVSIACSSWLVTKEVEKISTYECGFIPFSDSRMKFDISFYVISILFIIFDLEIVFLFPWALCFFEIGLIGLFSMAVFFIILTIGFVFEWVKGGLEL
jgi:NADH-quinone oxidoreductase subunit A